MRSIILLCSLLLVSVATAGTYVDSYPVKTTPSASDTININDSADINSNTGHRNVKNITIGSLPGYVPSWLPSSGPTAANQIIQATASGASAWTSTVQGLINDSGTGTDDLWSASKVSTAISAGRRITVSTSDPSGGQSGDVWFKVQ